MHMLIKKPATADAKIESQYNDNLDDGCDKVFYLAKTGFKGQKINIQQYRKRQSLKNQLISQHSRHQYFLNTLNQSTQIFGDTEQFPDINNSFVMEQEKIKPRRSVQTADIGFSSRRRMKEIQNDIIMKEQSKTMHVISNNYLATGFSMNSKRNIVLFKSQNLGKKMNEYMNIYIRQPPNNGQNINNALKTEGMIPHTKKMTSLARKIKVSKKQRATAHPRLVSDEKEKEKEKQMQELGRMYRTLDIDQKKKKNCPQRINKSQDVSIRKLKQKLMNKQH